MVRAAGRYELRIGSDLNRPLINMWVALQAGWIPPSEMSEDEYRACRDLPDDDPLKAFAGFGVSFAGRWFEGYARGSGAPNGNYAMSAKNSLLKKIQSLADVHFQCSDYSQIEYQDQDVVYCDPPYLKSTKTYGAVGKFDTVRFWSFYEDLSSRCDVFISEYEAPDGWVAVHSIETTTEVRSRVAGREPRIEKLFQFQGRRA